MIATFDSQVTLVKIDRGTPKEERSEEIKDIINKFNPSWIARLDLGGLSSCQQGIFYTGCLPEWIENLQNLEILRAAKLGIIILEPWLLALPHLTTLDLEQNQITTWPYFLAGSCTLQTVILDGNPCLERAFQKSPTLRSLYFSWNVTEAATKSIPLWIRGPEWHIAATARSSSGMNLNNLGYYCGGIYTLATQPNLFDDGYLTPLEPCRLMERQSRPMDEQLTAVSQDDTIQRKMPIYQGEGRKQAQIILQIFDDITCLINRNRLQQVDNRQPFVLLIGSPEDHFNRLLKGSTNRLNLEAIYKYTVILLKEEEEYISNLKTVEREFYYNGKVKSTYVSCCLRDIFSGFPAMRLIHEKTIKPALKNFVRAISFSLVRKSSPHYIPSMTVEETVVELCSSFRKLQLAFQKYAENIWITEHHLGLMNSTTDLYKDKDFKNYVEKQIARLGGVSGHLQFGNISPGVEMKPVYPDSSSDISELGDLSEELDMSKHKLLDWLYKHRQKSEKLFAHNMADFVYLPLIRLVRYERFFTSLVGTDQIYQPVLRVLRKLRKLCSTNIQQSREMARHKVLSNKFRTKLATFENYQWDAVFIVNSRGYLEPGILSENTNDVIDVEDQPASFVKEVFSDSRPRILRMVDCVKEVQIWDELFEHIVCKTKKSDIVALPGKNGLLNGLRLIFLDVRETCLVTVQDFNAQYFTPNNPNQELLEALCLVGSKKIL